MKVKLSVHEQALDSLLFESEISNGLEAIQKLLAVCYTGEDSDSCATLAPKHGYLGRVIHNAYRYAALGETQAHTFSTDELHDLIAFTLSARVNGELYSIGVPVNLERLLHTVVARAKLDRYLSQPAYEVELYEPAFSYSDQPELTLSEITLLSGMSEMAVRNASRSDGTDYLATIKRDGRVFIEPAVAVEWLKARQNFVPTQSTQGLDEKTQVLVPFAKDGSNFCGKYLRKRGYQVGAKGDEIYITDLYDALKHLKQMDKARWRRPNVNGIPGIVSVAEWQAISKADFEAV